MRELNKDEAETLKSVELDMLYDTEVERIVLPEERDGIKIHDITDVMWCDKTVRIAEARLRHDDLPVMYFRVTVKKKDGVLLFPGVYKINKKDAIEKYGIKPINKNNLMGIMIPFDDMKEYRGG